MKKNITIIGVNFYPEDTAIGLYTTQLANHLKIKGVEVNIITGFPYYPAWKINPLYRLNKTFYKESINGIKIYRYKQYVPKNPTFFKRILHLIDFTFGAFLNIFKIKETDVVLCIVPFTTTIFLGKILAILKNAKLWVHIQDFEFDAVSDSNIVEGSKSNPIFFKILFWIEKKLLNSTNLVSTISNSMMLKLSDKIKASNKRVLLPNWVDIDFINPEKSKVHPYLKSKKFKILYSGNIGEKQNWKFFIEFVKNLKEDVEFVVVGDGSKKEWLQKQLSEIKNITFYTPVAYDELSDLLCSTDLHILFQKNEVIDTVMPSKILAMMASQKPSLISGNINSEVHSIINNSGAGQYFGSKKISEILLFLKKIKENKDLADNYGRNARKYVSENFSKSEVLKQFENVFLDL